MWPSSKHPNASKCKNLRYYFKEYCNSTSIHGFRYFGEKRTCAERIWWFIIFVICLSGCVYFIILVYNKWENSPVIVSVSTKQIPIHKIPFPAITICPETKSKKSLYDHTDIIQKLVLDKELTLEEYKHISYMSLICDYNRKDSYKLRRYGQKKINNKFNSNVFEENEFFDFLYNVSLWRHVIFLNCYWMMEEYPCPDLFEPVMTDEGICYTFNMLHKFDVYKNNVLLPYIPFVNPDIPQNISWNMDDGYPDSDPIKTYPRRALFSGAKNAFELDLSEENENIDPRCKDSLQGFKVTLHTPTTVPRPSQHFFRLPLNHAVMGAIQPDMILTSDTVKMFKPVKRDCYFQNERPLKFFQHYNQQNCNLECLANFTVYWCGCVNFFMPRENGTRICGNFMFRCTVEANRHLQLKQLGEIPGIQYKLNRPRMWGLNTEEPPVPGDCKCLPLCSDISYNIETSSSQWNRRDLLDSFFVSGLVSQSEFERYRNISFSKLIIYFKNKQFVISQRHELYGPTDFLGNFGGLLGLFTGFSILSLMEIIYFLTVRIICNMKLYGHWSGSEK